MSFYLFLCSHSAFKVSRSWMDNHSCVWTCTLVSVFFWVFTRKVWIWIEFRKWWLAGPFSTFSIFQFPELLLLFNFWVDLVLEVGRWVLILGKTKMPVNNTRTSMHVSCICGSFDFSKINKKLKINLPIEQCNFCIEVLNKNISDFCIYIPGVFVALNVPVGWIVFVKPKGKTNKTNIACDSNYIYVLKFPNNLIHTVHIQKS